MRAISDTEKVRNWPRSQQRDAITFFVSAVVPPLTRGGRVVQRMFDAIEAGDLDAVKQLLLEQNHALLSAREDGVRMRTLTAAAHEHVFLIVTAVQLEQTPLIWAAVHGQAEVLQYLSEQGADVHASDIV
jgi:hypothetical protein